MSTKRQIIITALAVGGFLVLVGAVKAIRVSWASAAQGEFGPPPEAVTSIIVQEQSWPRSIEAVASLAANQGVTLSAQEPGSVSKILFESGDKVEQGKVLVELDTSVEQAALAGALARSNEAKRNFDRVMSLKPSHAMSQSDLDQAEAKMRDTESAVASLRATIERKKIIATFTGRVGIRMVNLGQYLSPGSNVVPLFSMNPLFINFAVPQQFAPGLKPGLAIEVRVDAFKDEVFKGTLSSINPQVDASMRNLQLQGTLANDDERLKPGMFAEVTLVLPEEDTYITAPASSVSFAPYGSSMYVIEEMKDPKGHPYRGVRQQIVKLGKRRGDQIAVLEGLKAGQEIVTSGVFKLRPGLAVNVNNQFAPNNEMAPKPADT